MTPIPPLTAPQLRKSRQCLKANSRNLRLRGVDVLRFAAAAAADLSEAAIHAEKVAGADSSDGEEFDLGDRERVVCAVH